MVVGFRVWGKLQIQAIVHKMRARDHRATWSLVRLTWQSNAKECVWRRRRRWCNIHTYTLRPCHIRHKAIVLAKNATCHHVGDLEHFKKMMWKLNFSPDVLNKIWTYNKQTCSNSCRMKRLLSHFFIFLSSCWVNMVPLCTEKIKKKKEKKRVNMFVKF